MKVKDIMTTPAFYALENESVFHIAKLMKKNDVGAIPVCNKEGKIVGVVTDRDIIIRAVGKGLNPASVSAKEIMSADVTVISPMTDLDDAFDIMSEIKIRRLPVVENSKLVGMLSLGDLSQSMEYTFEISDALSEVCRGCEKI